MKVSRIAFYFLMLLSFSSCVRYQNLVYMVETNGTSHNKYPAVEYKVRPFDNLYVKLTSLEQTTTTDFNQTGSSMQGGGSAPTAMLFLTGYIVDAEGSITLPLLGSLKVVGMTVNQIKVLLDSKLKEYVKEPSVSVKLVNYRVTMLGEVLRPGVQYVFEEKWTILQALSNAGGTSDFADIKRVKLIREEEGQTKTIYLDLSKPELISSEYFFLQPHDVIYIEPTKSRAFAFNSRAVSVTLSTISIILVLTNIILNNN